MKTEQLFQIHKQPSVRNGSLIVAWSEDAGALGTRVVEYLTGKLGGQKFAELEPAGFFSLRGVSVDNDVAQFPECNFYCCEEKNVVLLLSSPPRSDWYRFLNAILDVAKNDCQVKNVYTIGGMISLASHTTPQMILATANSAEFKNTIRQYNLTRSMDYETPPGQRPTLSSFLLWVAQKRGIAAATLWMPVSFYLVNAEDPRSCKKAIEFFNQALGISVDSTEIDNEIEAQDQQIAEIKRRFPEIGYYIQKLEGNLGLAEEESEQLIKKMAEQLRKRPK